MVFKLCLSLVLLLYVCPEAYAGVVSFTNIAQSTQTPGDPDDLFGPEDTSIPNQLLFPSPAMFAATAGGAGGFDITDSLLTFSVTVDDPNMTWITEFTYEDTLGTWSLEESIPGFAGLGTNVTNRILGGLTITSVDGVPVGGPTIPLIAPVVSFNAQDDLPPGFGVWDNDVTQVLPVSEYGRVTSFDVSIDNRLVAFSEGNEEGNSISFIDKKRVTIRVETEMIPEPMTLALAVASLGLVVVTTAAGRSY